MAQDGSLFTKLLPVVTQERVLVETSLASATIQELGSEQYIQEQWNQLVTMKGYEEIMKN